MNSELDFENNRPMVTFENQENNLSFDAPKTEIKGTSNYEKLENLPSINNVLLIGNKTTDDLGIKVDNDYNNASNKPKINGVELIGDLSTDDLGIEAGGSDVGIITEFDIEKTYEDNEVYNANAIHQLMEVFGYEIMNVMEYIENHEERISALEN